jgi:hypothetical protein
MMSISVTALLGLVIILIAIFPGILGNKIYQSIIGLDWRDSETKIIFRLAGFSVAGVVLYSIVSDLVYFIPPPIHLIPGSYKSISVSPDNLYQIIHSYVGHLMGGAVAGILGALCIILLSKISSVNAYPGSWDFFIRKLAPEHWVLIGLNNGDIYAGKISSADLSVSKDERDIVLEEPCIYVENDRNYMSLNYQYMFISSSNIYSIIVINDPDKDKRLIPIGDYLFKGEVNNVE